MSGAPTMTLPALLRCVSDAIVRDVPRLTWVTCQLSDFHISRGHCYMELVEKNDRGEFLARAKGIIWASSARLILNKFYQATGHELAGDMKVMVLVSPQYSAQYGFSLIISDIDPSYTLGDVERRRREIIDRLTREGILDQNRNLPWPRMANRVAIISASTAAGYGDFRHQLLTNRRHLRFTTKLFPAAMQGQNTAASVIDALGAVASDSDEWDCVVIIRGGGSSSDLAAFDSYELAAAIAMYPLPVIIGIGHERDITVLDWVANMRVKTPTAAAEWLISHGVEQLDMLRDLSLEIVRAASERISGERQRLDYCATMTRIAPVQALESRRQRLETMTARLSSLSGRIDAEKTRLDSRVEMLRVALNGTFRHLRERLDRYDGLLQALSPEATLRRGYSITRINGHAVTDTAELSSGDVVETVLANGSVTSTIN